MDFLEQTIFWLLAGSKGAVNRLRIVEVLKEKPMNLNELSAKLGLNYKTVQHHVELLAENNLVVARGARYGQVYFLSESLGAKSDLIKKLSGQKSVEEKK